MDPESRRPTPRRKSFRPGVLLALSLIVPARGAAAPFPDEIVNKFVHLTIKDGLSQGSALAVLQDRRGFLWIGTEDGLNRYDGYSFKVYKPSSAPDSLSDKWVRALLEDSEGVLWAGTLTGLNRYDRDRDNFVRFRHDPRVPESLSHNVVTSLCEDRAKTLWVGTEGGGLDAFDRGSGKFTAFRHDPKDPASLSHDSVYGLAEDREGFLWVATDGGLNRFDPATRHFTRFRHDPHDPASLSDDRVRAVFEDREGTLWAGTEGGGLNAFDRKTGRFTRYRNAFNDPRSLSDDLVYAIAQDREGRLLVGTNGGLNLFNPPTKNFTVLQNNPADAESLGYDYVASIYEDRTGILWIGTRGRGLEKYVADRRKFLLFECRPGDPDSLSSNTIRSIAEDDRGRLWIGTEDKGLDRLDRRTGKADHFHYDPRQPGGLASNNVYALLLDAEGALWAGTLGGGLNRFDPRSGSFSHFRHSEADPGSLSHDSVRCLALDRRGSLWAGTEGGGLDRLDPGRSAFAHFRNDPADPGSLGHNSVRALRVDRAGTLWIGTFGGGLDRFDAGSGKFVHYRHDPANPHSLCNDYIMTLAEDGSGRIWIGTNGGLACLDPRTGEFTCTTEQSGLPNNSIYGVLVDEHDGVWFSSNRGLARMAPGIRAIKTYDVSDGLQSDEFNGGSAYRSKSGEMFFGGTSGLNSFFPGRLKDNPFPPPVVITDFQIFNKPVPIGRPVNGSVVLARAIENTDEVVVHLRDRSITLGFAALHFAAPEKNRYAYLMEGLETEWNDAAGRRFANYTNLPAGRYTFRVKASNNDGVWNEEGVALRIRVVPPFWRTTLFLALAAAGFLILAATAVGARLKAIHGRAAALERKVEARTAQLQEQVEVRKKAEEELARRRKYLEAVLFNSSNAIVATDAAAKVIDWSSGAEKIFGWSRAEVLGRDIDEVVTVPEFREDARRRSREAISGRPVTAGEAVRHRKDGTPIDVIVAGSPILIGDEPIGSMFVYTDITGLKRAEAAAREASRAKSEFLANMSHEIRTPMNGIFGMTELALETDLSADQREYLTAVKASAESLMTIINDILDFSKIEAKKIEMETIPFRLRDTVHAIVSGVALLAEKKGLELLYEVPPETPDAVKGDPGRLRQILTNLLGNAIKFTAKGEVAVTVEAEEKTADRVRLHFRVRDTGIGIPPDKLKLVFDPFTQADSSTTRMYGGTGLGLTICAQLVALMDGRIWAESEEGRGSTFHFAIDLEIQDKGAEETIPARFEDLRDLTALVVDDNATNRRILQELLSRWGLLPTAVEGAAGALEALRASAAKGRPFRLIITDVNMPVQDGFDLAGEIKGHPEYGDALIMMLSSSGFRGDSARCRELGLTAYLTKPVKPSILLDAILLALGTSAEKRADAPLITRHSLVPSPGRFAILLAEDNIINQKLAVRILENKGHRVMVVDNGEEALAAWARGGFDVILMDVQMPRMDGFQATAAIRRTEKESGGHVPIVAMTAHAMAGDRQKCLDAGMDDYVSKPLKPQDLLKTIEQAAVRPRP